MAILSPNKDGSSSAKAGDIVITGGGIFQKNADGTSTRRTDLEADTGYSGGVKASEYNALTTTIYNTVKAGIEKSENYTGSRSSGGGSNTTPGAAGTSGATNPTSGIPDAIGGTDYSVGFDTNGIGYINGFSPYDFGNYSNNSVSGDTSNTVKNVLGYIILGIIGLVLLDRALGK